MPESGFKRCFLPVEGVKTHHFNFWPSSRSLPKELRIFVGQNLYFFRRFLNNRTYLSCVFFRCISQVSNRWCFGFKFSLYCNVTANSVKPNPKTAKSKPTSFYLLEQNNYHWASCPQKLLCVGPIIQRKCLWRQSLGQRRAVNIQPARTAEN